MIDVIATISLSGIGDIAQVAIAAAAVFGLGGVVIQVWIGRRHLHQERVFEYSRRFNEPSFIKLTARHTDFWQAHTYAQWKTLDREDRAEWLIVANFIEEIATLYNRGLVNRSVAAQVFGSYVENLWNHSLPLIQGARSDRSDDWIFAEWEEMKNVVPTRQLKTQRKITRQRTQRKFFRGF
jgi:hypothetical protein